MRLVSCASFAVLFLVASASAAPAHHLGGLPPPPPTPLWKGVLLIVAAALITAEVGFFRMRSRRHPDPEAEAGRAAESWWTATPLLLLALVGVSRLLPGASAAAAVTVLGPGAPPPGAFVVSVTARQFVWEFHYPQEKVSSRNELHVPIGRDLALRLSSRDVLHSLDIPGLGIHQDIYYGRPVRLGIRIPQAGRYPIVCTALCGGSAQEMQGVLVAEPPADFDRWLRFRMAAPAAATSSSR